MCRNDLHFHSGPLFLFIFYIYVYSPGGLWENSRLACCTLNRWAERKSRLREKEPGKKRNMDQNSVSFFAEINAEEMDLHIKAIKGKKKESWSNRSIHVLRHSASVMCCRRCRTPKVSTIPIRRDINKASQSRDIHTWRRMCVYVCARCENIHTYTLTELIIQKRRRRRFRVARDRREPRKRIDLDLSRHFTVNFVSTADETRIIR